MDGRISQTGRWRDERRGEWVREGHQIQMKTEINKVHYRHPPAGFQLKLMETACNKLINILNKQDKRFKVVIIFNVP